MSTNRQDDSQDKKSKLLANFGDKRHVLNAEDRKKGVDARLMRAEIQKKLVKAVIGAGIVEKVAYAINTGDDKLMSVCEKAIKMIGSHFDQSSEAKQQIEVSGDVGGKFEFITRRMEKGETAEH